MTDVTDEMIETGARAVWDRLGCDIAFDEAKSNGHAQYEWVAADVAAALSAALSVQAEPVNPLKAENAAKIKAVLDWADSLPDAWLIRDPDGQLATFATTRPQEPSDLLEILPLYLHPPVQVPVVKDGWKLVPIEPTNAILDAGRDYCDSSHNAGTAYRAMITAAPLQGETE